MKHNYDHYRTFYYAAKYKSFSKAAKVLNNNQPNVTRTIYALEAELGCKLFQRSNRGVKLTNEGKILFQHVDLAYSLLNNAEIKLMEKRDLENGSISLAVSEIALYDFMMATLSEFSKEYPHIRINIKTTTTPEAIELLKNGDVELAITTTPSSVESYLEMIELKTVEDVLIASEAFSELKDKEISLIDIKDYPIISIFKGSKSYEIYSDVFDEQNLEFSPIIETSSAFQTLNFVANGSGIGFVPKSLIKETNRPIFVVDLKEKLQERTLSILWDKKRLKSLIANKLTDIVLKKNGAL